MTHTDADRRRDARQEAPRRAGSPRPGRVPFPAPGQNVSPAELLTIQHAVGNRNANLILQRAGEPSTTATRPEAAQQSADNDQHALARSITGGGTKTKEVTEALEDRVKNGPPFSPQEIELIQKNADKDPQWLETVGIGTWNAAYDYLFHAKEQKNWRDWLNLKAGKRLLVATLAWEKDRLRSGVSRETPSHPAYTLGRTLALRGSGYDMSDEDRARHVEERDRQIRDTFVRTLRPGKPEGIAAEYEAKDARAREILTRVFLILQNGLKIYKQNDHIDYREGYVARALAHGGRVNIRIPQLESESKHAMTDWIGLTQDGKDVHGGGRHPFATHYMEIGDNVNKVPGTGTFKERGGPTAAMQNAAHFWKVELYGPNLSAGGLGKRDINDDVILPDGSHGHMLLAFTPPTKKRDGALQVGIETTAPSADNPVGYQHTITSTEATANPESSFYGHKVDKIGEGPLEVNQRLVDLTKPDTTGGQHWTLFLHDLQVHWTQLLARASDDDNATRGLYEQLAGRRADMFRPNTRRQDP